MTCLEEIVEWLLSLSELCQIDNTCAQQPRSLSEHPEEVLDMLFEMQDEWVKRVSSELLRGKKREPAKQPTTPKEIFPGIANEVVKAAFSPSAVFYNVTVIATTTQQLLINMTTSSPPLDGPFPNHFIPLSPTTPKTTNTIIAHSLRPPPPPHIFVPTERLKSSSSSSPSSSTSTSHNRSHWTARTIDRFGHPICPTSFSPAELERESE